LTDTADRPDLDGADGWPPGTPPTNRRVTFLVHRVNAKIEQVCNPLFRIHQLDLVSSRILALLIDREGMRVGELVDEMVLPQSTVSHQLQRLERRKLLRKQRAADDARAVAISLTDRGRAVAAECRQLSLAVYKHLMDGLEPGEVSELIGLLDRMFATLETFRRV